MKAPLIRGGQGRRAQQVFDSACISGMCGLGLLLIFCISLILWTVGLL